MPTVSVATTGFRLISATLRFLEAHEQVRAVFLRETAEGRAGNKWRRSADWKAAVQRRKDLRRQMLDVARSYRDKLAAEEATGIRRRRHPGEPKPSQFRVERAPRHEEPPTQPEVSPDDRSAPGAPPEQETVPS
jgi:hypothetical protein